MAFDKTLAQVFADCVGRRVASEALHAEYDTQARTASTAVPSTDFRTGLRQALLDLARAGWLIRSFDRDVDQWVYTARQEHTAAAAAATQLKSSVLSHVRQTDIEPPQ